MDKKCSAAIDSPSLPLSRWTIHAFSLFSTPLCFPFFLSISIPRYLPLSLYLYFLSLSISFPSLVSLIISSSLSYSFSFTLFLPFSPFLLFSLTIFHLNSFTQLPQQARRKAFNRSHANRSMSSFCDKINIFIVFGCIIQPDSASFDDNRNVSTNTRDTICCFYYVMMVIVDLSLLYAFWTASRLEISQLKERLYSTMVFPKIRFYLCSPLTTSI